MSSQQPKINGDHHWFVRGLATTQKYENEKIGRVRTWTYPTRDEAHAKAAVVTTSAQGAPPECDYALVDVRAAGTGKLWTVVGECTPMQTSAVASLLGILKQHSRAWEDYHVVAKPTTLWINQAPGDAVALLNLLLEHATTTEGFAGGARPKAVIGKVLDRVVPLAVWISDPAGGHGGNFRARVEILPAGTTPQDR